MKNKKSISMILAAAVLSTGISFMPARASAVTKDSVKVESKEQKKNVKAAVQKAIKDLNEENIKEARKMVAEIEDTNLRTIYNKALEYNIYKNMDKKISPVDELMVAFDKTSKVTSCESNIKVDLNMEGKNLTQEEIQNFAPIMQIINGIKIDGKSKFVGNGKNTQISTKSDFNLSFMNQIYKMSAWIDMNMEGKDQKMKYVITIPEAIKAFSPELKGKDYFVYDSEKLTKELAQNADYEKIMESSMKFGNKMQGAMVDFLRAADAKFNLVTRKDKQAVTVGNTKENVDLYQIKLDNEKLTEVIKFALQDKEMNKIIKDYVKFSINLGAEMQNQEVSAEELKEMEKEVDEGLNQLVVMLEELNKSVKYEVVFDFGVNKDGYISYQTGSIKFTVDAGKLQGADSKSQYTFVIKFSGDAYNINEKVNIEAMPEVNEKNSIDYVELLKKGMSEESEKEAA
ncbi:hypothetical protein [Clostridium sp. ZS2-4]|uniref:hypothetical protein n=1 Tax=Clostridium sp. ZS2-4 TaxID=2987703 RepID=UPI00227D3C18|nr:hypothetical protein [Clostridium sp. ZS2-4]MCY6355274.1 hypothetical protein [Clostridium sp. ZS2-4]